MGAEAPKSKLNAEPQWLRRLGIGAGLLSLAGCGLEHVAPHVPMKPCALYGLSETDGDFSKLSSKDYPASYDSGVVQVKYIKSTSINPNDQTLPGTLEEKDGKYIVSVPGLPDNEHLGYFNAPFSTPVGVEITAESNAHAEPVAVTLGCIADPTGSAPKITLLTAEG